MSERVDDDGGGRVWVGRRYVCVSCVLVCRSGWACVMAREVKAMGALEETGGWESIQFTALVLRRVWFGWGVWPVCEAN